MRENARQLCFVDMPFGRKTDPGTRVTIDFDQIYETGIAPAVVRAGLKPIRGDQEETGGIIHRAMFARLLLSEYVIADMTTANPNVFYELGVRHAAKPYTTIPIFATLGAPPFDVNMVRAIPYDLEDGQLTEAAADELVKAIAARIEAVQSGPVHKDSPIFELFPEFEGVTMTHELTDVFRERVQSSNELQQHLRIARETKPRDAAVEAIRDVAELLGDPSTLERGALLDLLLSYRAVEAWPEMIDLFERMPGNVQTISIVRQQLAFALNRRNGQGDRDRAIEVLEELRRDEGDSAETLGLLGRVYKDLYAEAKAEGSLLAYGRLDQAIEAYTRGFEFEPLDFYPGVNAITLLLQKDGDEAQAEIDRLTPLVTFAAVRQSNASGRSYWVEATILELACVARDYAQTDKRLINALPLANEAWMLKTTAANLKMIADRRADEDDASRIEAVIAELLKQAAKLDGTL